MEKNSKSITLNPKLKKSVTATDPTKRSDAPPTLSKQNVEDIQVIRNEAKEQPEDAMRTLHDYLHKLHMDKGIMRTPSASTASGSLEIESPVQGRGHVHHYHHDGSHKPQPPKTLMGGPTGPKTLSVFNSTIMPDVSGTTPPLEENSQPHFRSSEIQPPPPGNMMKQSLAPSDKRKSTLAPPSDKRKSTLARASMAMKSILKDDARQRPTLAPNTISSQEQKSTLSGSGNHINNPKISMPRGSRPSVAQSKKKKHKKSKHKKKGRHGSSSEGSGSGGSNDDDASSEDEVHGHKKKMSKKKRKKLKKLMMRQRMMGGGGGMMGGGTMGGMMGGGGYAPYAMAMMQQQQAQYYNYYCQQYAYQNASYNPKISCDQLQMTPMKSSAFIADNVNFLEGSEKSTCPSVEDNESGEEDELEDGVAFSYKPRPNGRTEMTVTVEPKKQPWLTMMRFGFRPVVNCTAPPCYLSPNSRPGLQFQPSGHAQLVHNAYHYPPPLPTLENIRKFRNAESSSSGSSSSSDSETEQVKKSRKKSKVNKIRKTLQARSKVTKIEEVSKSMIPEGFRASIPEVVKQLEAKEDSLPPLSSGGSGSF